MFRYVRDMTESRHPACACFFCGMIISFFCDSFEKKIFAFDKVILTKKFDLCAISRGGHR